MVLFELCDIFAKQTTDGNVNGKKDFSASFVSIVKPLQRFVHMASYNLLDYRSYSLNPANPCIRQFPCARKFK